MAEPAEMITDGPERPGRSRRNRHFGHCSRLDVCVDFQCANHEAMRRVGACQLQRDRLTLDQRYMIGCEVELARCDLHDLSTLGSLGAERYRMDSQIHHQ